MSFFYAKICLFGPCYDELLTIDVLFILGSLSSLSSFYLPFTFFSPFFFPFCIPNCALSALPHHRNRHSLPCCFVDPGARAAKIASFLQPRPCFFFSMIQVRYFFFFQLYSAYYPETWEWVEVEFGNKRLEDYRVGREETLFHSCSFSSPKEAHFVKCEAMKWERCSCGTVKKSRTVFVLTFYIRPSLPLRRRLHIYPKRKGTFILANQGRLRDSGGE